jgi:hypothetical protein
VTRFFGMMRKLQILVPEVSKLPKDSFSQIYSFIPNGVYFYARAFSSVSSAYCSRLGMPRHFNHGVENRDYNI